MIVDKIEYIALEEVKIGGITFKEGSSLPYPGWNYQGLIAIHKVKRIVNKVNIPVPSPAIKIKVKKRGKKRRNKSS